MRTEITEITPEQAKTLLKFNSINRPYRKWRMESHLRSMHNGNWRITHQGIAVTGDSVNNPGKLLDGQHRLNAVIHYGKPVCMQVSYGLPDDTFMVIDRGATRTVADVLNLDTASVGVCGIFLHFSNMTGKPTPDDVIRVWGRIEPAYSMLVTTKANRISTSPVRAGFILKMMEQEGADQRQEIADLYALLVNRDYKTLPAVLSYYIKTLDTAIIRGGGHAYSSKVACNAVRALDNINDKILRDNKAAEMNVASRFRQAIA